MYFDLQSLAVLFLFEQTVDAIANLAIEMIERSLFRISRSRTLDLELPNSQAKNQKEEFTKVADSETLREACS